MKILILKPSSLGDVVQALPVLRLIKRHLPDSQIYWWIDSRLAPLLENDPDLTGVIPFEREGWAGPGKWIRLWRTLRWARQQRFDWVIDLQCLARSGLFAWLANGRFTVGLDEEREGARGYYDQIAQRPAPRYHAVDWYLAVLPLLGVPAQNTFEWLPSRPELAAAMRAKWLTPGHDWLILQPGARWLNKRWPVESFAALAQAVVSANPSIRIAVLGGTEDRPLGQAIAGAVNHATCLDLTGRLSLPEMVECIRLSKLMVTNDTGPMHVAAALRKPVVALFGPTDPYHTGPYGQTQNALQLDLPCIPCQRPRCTYKKPLECLRALRTEQVLKVVQAALQKAE